MLITFNMIADVSLAQAYCDLSSQRRKTRISDGFMIVTFQYSGKNSD